MLISDSKILSVNITYDKFSFYQILFKKSLLKASLKIKLQLMINIQFGKL